MENVNAVDALFVLVSAFLVFFMNAGFALVESGLCRSKNTVNILTKNFIVFGLAVVGYWTIGYALMFGGGEGALTGSEWFFLEGIPAAQNGVPHLVFFFFQLCFAVTAATIVSGAVAERIKIQSFMVFALILTAVIYPIVGHWGWGGGWLAERGFGDFAGSTIVHSVGGWAALVGAFLLGPRDGKYDKAGKLKPIPGHNLALVTLGGLFLWFGWFGFNGGSNISIAGAENMTAVAHIITVTAIAGAVGTLAATFCSWIQLGKPDLTFIVNGMLGGLVGITAGCNVVPLWAGALIGLICGIVVIQSVLFFDKVRIDDPVGAISVHLVCGALGTILVGVFSVDGGLVFGEGAGLLVTQLIGVGAVGAFVVTTSLVVWLIIKATLGMRVSAEEEYTGLDIAEHGLEAYPEKQ